MSKEEKANLVRLMVLQPLLSELITVYTGLKSTDKKFLTELKHGQTRLKKAVDIRLDDLEPEAMENLTKSVAKMHLMFLPTPEAKKEHKAAQEIRTHFPMAMDDFNDWYGFVIETTCKTCTRADYEECAARRVLTKYDVFPVDPEAQGKCQYSYTDGVAAVEAAVTAIMAAAEDSGEEEVLVQPEPEPESEPILSTEPAALLVRQTGELDAPAATAKDDGLLSTDIILNSGYKAHLLLPEHMAHNILNEFKRPNRNSRALCGCHLGSELVAIDMAEVAMMTITGMPEGTWQKEKPVYSQPTPARQPIETAPEPKHDEERERYRVECECGQEYFCSMNTGRDRARCRECKATLFADRQAERVKDPVDGDFATLLTNRYWVQQAERREPSKFSGKAKYGYADPCNPFA